jgi:epoxyqueuosine reductase
MFCNLELSSGEIAVDQCLNCRLCLDACPTEALSPYRLEPTKCLAYQNIEKRGERNQEYWRDMGAHLVGCDVCQEVCPWNVGARDSRLQSLFPGFEKHALGDLKSLLQMGEGDYRMTTKTTAISRIKYTDFMRNVFLVIANKERGDLLLEVKAWRDRHSNLDLAECDYCINVLSRFVST